MRNRRPGFFFRGNTVHISCESLHSDHILIASLSAVDETRAEQLIVTIHVVMWGHSTSSLSSHSREQHLHLHSPTESINSPQYLDTQLLNRCSSYSTRVYNYWIISRHSILCRKQRVQWILRLNSSKVSSTTAVSTELYYHISGLHWTACAIILIDWTNSLKIRNWTWTKSVHIKYQSMSEEVCRRSYPFREGETDLTYWNLQKWVNLSLTRPLTHPLTHSLTHPPSHTETALTVSSNTPLMKGRWAWSILLVPGTPPVCRSSWVQDSRA